LLVGCIAVVLADENKQQLLKVIQNESDKDCVAEKNVDFNVIFSEFQTCVQQVSQSFQVSLYMGQGPVDPVDAVVKFLCDNPALTKCITDLEDGLGVCLNAEKKQQLADQFKPLFALLDTACEDNGQSIKDLISKGSECLSAKKYGIMQCVQDVVNVMSPQQAETFDDLKSEEGCTHAKSIQTCVVGVLDTCSDDTASKFFNKLFNALLKNSHCAQYLDENTV